MDLLIDLGNSRLKWAWSDKTLWQTGATDLDKKSAADLLEDVGEPQGAPRRIGMVSVAADVFSGELARAVEAKWGVEVRVIKSAQEQAGVHNGYGEPGQLGSDRWAALVAARQETQLPICVIGCGTAVTVDAMNANGEFVGGVIFPGLEILRQSLRQGTAGIRLDSNRDSDNTCQATSTTDAVIAGTRFGLAGAIGKIVAEHHRVLGANTRNLITGGSVGVLAPLLDFPFHHIPDLVLRGIKRILEEQS